MKTKDCQTTRRRLDDFISGELSVEADEQVLQHLETCDSCRGERLEREAVREQLRDAWHGQEIPSGLRDRVADDWQPRRTARPWMGWAAGVLLTVSVSYGVWRLVPQQSPLVELQSVTVDHYSEVVQDHLGCEEREPPPRYTFPFAPHRDEVHAALRGIPGDFRLSSAHLCRSGEVEFVHYSFRDHLRTFSLILEERAPEERLPLLAAGRRREIGNIPVNLVQREQISVVSSEGRNYFIYLVTEDPDPATAIRIAENILPVTKPELFSSL